MTSSFAPSTQQRKPGVTVEGRGVVAAQHWQAAEIGAQVLAEGGDAVDSAVAVSFALGVLEPWMSGPMGGGAMMLWRADEARAYALNYGMCSSGSLDLSTYPLAGTGAASDLFPWDAVVDDRNVIGATAVAVPGTVAGISAAHTRFGKMRWRELLQPAVEAARTGLHVDWYAALIIASSAQSLAKDADAAALFLEDGKWPKISGWTALADIRLNQSQQADCLSHLAEAGADDFYTGDIAATLIKDVTDKGGFLTAEDLAAYRAEWQDPLMIPYRDGRIWTVPKLSAGPTLADAVASWTTDYPASEAAGPQAHTARARALQDAYARRLETMGDHESPTSPGCTAHFCIVDKAGNMVSMTQTLLSIFGSRVVSPGTGMLLNNGIMWFDPVAGRPNSLAPNKKCLMNVCPVIGEVGDRRFALGASGGRKIMPAVGQIAGHIIEQGMSMQDAIEAPRLDASGGGTIILDERLSEDVAIAVGIDHEIARAKRLPFPFAFACPAGVMRENNINSGTTETFSPWGDGVAEPLRK